MVLPGSRPAERSKNGTLRNVNDTYDANGFHIHSSIYEGYIYRYRNNSPPGSANARALGRYSLKLYLLVNAVGGPLRGGGCPAGRQEAGPQILLSSVRRLTSELGRDAAELEHPSWS